MRNEKLKRRRNVFVDIPWMRRFSCFLIKAILLSTVRLLLNAKRKSRLLNVLHMDGLNQPLSLQYFLKY